MRVLNALSVAALSVAALLSPAAYAVEPVGSATFNTSPGFDLSTLNAGNFYKIIVPLAKKEGKLTFFDFTNSFGPLFSDNLLPEFEAKYNINVDYVRGKGGAAVQQLIAANKAGSPAPSDVYFVGSSSIPLLLDSGVMANIPLNKLLPNAFALNPDIATITSGFDHGGAYLPFHRNQTSIIYNTRFVSTKDVPSNLDSLLTWAKAHPGQFVVTSPAGGGSGKGFMQSVAIARITGEKCRAPFTNFAISAAKAKAYAAGDCPAPLWNYYRELLPVVEISNGNSDTLNLIATGGGIIGTAWEDMAYDFMGRGLLPKTTRQELLVSGQVGGGDGMFLPVNGTNPAAGLLFLDFMISHKVQLEKLLINGSRSARTDIDPSASFSAEQSARLIPTDQFATRARQQIPSKLANALRDYLVANLLRGQ